MTDTVEIHLREYDAACVIAMGEERGLLAIDEGPWNGSASNYTDAQYQRACALDRQSCGGRWQDAAVKSRCSLPYKTPTGEVSRRGTHAAAQRIGAVNDACPAAIATAKSRLRSAYSQLGEDPPDSIKGVDFTVDEARQQALAASVNVSLQVSLIETIAGRCFALPKAMMNALVARALSGDMGGFEAVSRSKTAQPEGNGIGVISLSGTITPQASLLAQLLGVDSGGLDSFRAGLRQLVADPDVAKIVMNIDSPGGMVDMVPETAAAIRNAGEKKPIVAVANTMAASAAYWLASQAHEIVVSPSAQVGSVGVYSVHEDVSGMLEARGVKPTLISAGKYKVQGNPFEPLDVEGAAAMQEPVDYYYSMFVNDVANGRGVVPDPSALDEGTIFGGGKTFPAKAAIKQGLADREATLAETVSRLSSRASRVRRFGAPRSEALPDETNLPETSPEENGNGAGKRELTPEEKTQVRNVRLAFGV